MSENAPERPPTAHLIDALDVRRNATFGFGLGLLLAVVVFAFFVAIPGTYRSPILYVGLAFVIAFTSGVLFTVALTARSARRLARELD